MFITIIVVIIIIIINSYEPCTLYRSTRKETLMYNTVTVAKVRWHAIQIACH